jgi:GNAT superfamily N-acetyltransferase
VALEIRPATKERWEDVVAVFGRRGRDPSWCWCQRFLRVEAADDAAKAAGPDNRDALRREIGAAPMAPGLIAYNEGAPVGWTRVGLRRAFPGVTENRALTRVLGADDRGAWWVTCFVVDGRHRGLGVGSALLRGAVEFARAHHAAAVEGHPVDVAALQAARVSGSALFTGTMAMFLAAGFTEVARTHRSRPVMRLGL